MTSHVGRLVRPRRRPSLVFFLAWAAIAARPWSEATPPRPRPRASRALAAPRRTQLRADAARSRARSLQTAGRWAVHRATLARQRTQARRRLRRTQHGRRRRTPAVRVVHASAARRSPTELVMQRHCFAAMGTDVELPLDGGDERRAGSALWAAEAEFHRLESAALALPRRIPSSRRSTETARSTPGPTSSA